MAASVLLLSLLACTGDKGDDTGPPAGETWAVLAEDQPAALLSVWGSSATDVWVVGADAGAGPAVHHFDGSAWATVDTGTSGEM